ncbi:membrane protein insertase YidC [Limibaculum sp. M0105]|uniref:Membrane protein insertase YidC n=1 Tax=Thermohalobaculum xanthum TaxID=2753746 RepID=A0A8J7SCB1_9RHOB|nr:membrane protein insertase YidC [Thermohalobaculum xanthum]MBK0398146.1 membrane protein insertase YidC [Thermohalobaculum xanthum]
MGGDKSDTRNLLLAAVLSMAVIFTWQAFFAPPPEVEPEVTAEQGAGTPGTDAATTGAPVAGAAGATADAPAGTINREAALERSERIAIGSNAVTGSISLRGARLDDLHLSDYRETLDPDSDTVVLLNPTGSSHPYYAVHGWLRTVEGNPGPLPGANTEWTVESGEKLTPETPVTLRWDNGEGLIFRKTISLDERYMFTVTQSVQNTTDAPVSIAPYGYIARRGEPDGMGFFILHEGAIGMFDGELSEVDYSDMQDMPQNPLEGGLAEAHTVTADGWLGFTDHYWMTTLAPRPGQAFSAVYKVVPGAVPEFRTEMRLPAITIPAGEFAEIETNLFAGAKELKTIARYEETLGIDRFYDSVDWGWFYFLTKPIAWLLNAVQGVVGNMGFSIIVLTLIIKSALFPLAYKSFVAMSKMKKLQPEMEKIKERAGDDRQKLQMEMMALYKKEKVNPASGCLPILLQIPIFFSLYKVLFVTIEMRHAPFIGWIKDLSAPDPTSWINLFGLLPYDVSWAPVFISIGVFPILMGVTMWLQQKLNPAPADPTQAMIFAWMPWVFMFMLGSFASGLVIYWTANNILTFTQQYIIMRSQGVEVDIFGNIKRSFKRKPEGKAHPAQTARKAKGDTAKAEDAEELEVKPANPPRPTSARGKRRQKAAAGGASGAPHGDGKQGTKRADASDDSPPSGGEAGGDTAPGGGSGGGGDA